MELRSSNDAYLKLIQEERDQRRERLKARKLKQITLKKDLPAEPARHKKIVKAKKQPGKQNVNAKQERKELRLQRVDHKLYEQMKMVQERVERMDKDKELYYLIGFERKDHRLEFTIIKKEDEEKALKIRVNEKFEVSCNCMDWRIRCVGMAIACKHIYYLLQTMLNYELYDYFDNQIMNPQLFEEQIKKRLRTNVDFEVKNVHKNLVCPICFINDQTMAVKKCPDCNINVHEECMRIWLKYSNKRNCVYCRSEAWNMFF